MGELDQRAFGDQQLIERVRRLRRTVDQAKANQPYNIAFTDMVFVNFSVAAFSRAGNDGDESSLTLITSLPKQHALQSIFGYPEFDLLAGTHTDFTVGGNVWPNGTDGWASDLGANDSRGYDLHWWLDSLSDSSEAIRAKIFVRGRNAHGARDLTIMLRWRYVVPNIIGVA